MNARIDLKIQVRSPGQSALEALPWADLAGEMPEFHAYGDAHQWLVDNDMMWLTECGLDFRIVPADFPCAYSAMLEINAQGGEVKVLQ